ncbi:ATP-binding cassette domain-containing protein [Pasteurella testudinis]|nr:ATP-binding cassette domain-containing protein [Pasteurella testudinis]
MINGKGAGGGDPLLEVHDVSVRYNNGHTALHDVSFSLNGGTTCALVGVNGSGKSTLFKSLMGLVKPLQGSIKLHGLPVKQALKQNLVSYVPQAEEVDWQFPISVYDVVMTGRYGYMNFLRIPSQSDKQKVEQAMQRVDIVHLRDRQIGELSGGQKKRVFLARALAQESKIILLDEPFTGVDVKTENAIVELLGQLRSEGHLILVSTHNLGSVPHFCDQVVMINRTVIAAGNTETTFTQNNLKLVFGGVLRYLTLDGQELHDDEDNRTLTVLTDDERPVVFYGEKGTEIPPTSLATHAAHAGNANKAEP